MAIITKTFNQFDVYDIHEDVQRIEVNCKTLQERVLALLGIDLSLTIKEDWTRLKLPTAEEMQRIRGNVEALVQTMQSSYTIPIFDNHFDYKNANDLELAIRYMDKYLQDLISIISQPRAGFYCASEPLFLIAERQVIE